MDEADGVRQLPGQASIPLSGRDLLVLYGSETGNSQDLAEDLSRCAERLHFNTTVLEMDETDMRTLLGHGLAIFVVSTTGQGDMPQNAVKFWKSLLRKRLPPNCLAGLMFTTFGLGDSSYDKFNWAARKLQKRLDQLGAVQFQPAGEADDQHDQGIEGTYLPWRLELRSRLLALYPLPDSIQPIPDGVLLQPKVWLELDPTAMAHYPNEKAAYFCHPDTPSSEEAKHIHYRATQDIATLARYTDSTHRASTLGERPVDTLDSLNQLKDEPSLYSVRDSHSASAFPPEYLLPLPSSWNATVVENKRITPVTHWQDVRQLVLSVRETDPGDCESLVNKPLAPGDTVCLWPKNFPADVQALITMMGWEEAADSKIRFRQKVPKEGWSYGVGTGTGNVYIGYPPKGCHIKPGSTLRDILTHNFDITAIPKRSLFELMAANTSDREHRTRLLEFADLAHTDEFYDYTTRPRRSILEVLQEFPSVKLSWEDVVRIFPVIRPRQFSVANWERLEAANTGKPDGARGVGTNPVTYHIHLLIAIVKYKTVLRKTRRGLLSRYVEDLPEQSVIRFTLKRSAVPFNFSTVGLMQPALAIATGTGIAPIHAFFAVRNYHRAKAICRFFPEDEGQLTMAQRKERDQIVHMARQRKVELMVKAQKVGMPIQRKSKLGSNAAAPREEQEGDAGGQIHMGSNVLFFGSRNRNADFYFKDDWVDWGVRVFPAFSRDPVPTAASDSTAVTRDGLPSAATSIRQQPGRPTDQEVGLPIRTQPRAESAPVEDVGADPNAQREPIMPTPTVGPASVLTRDSELLSRGTYPPRAPPDVAVNKTLEESAGRVNVVLPKRYVQQAMLENYGVVCDLVRQGCIILICGSKGRMAVEVKLALAECLVRGKFARNIAHADSILNAMVFFWEETW